MPLIIKKINIIVYACIKILMIFFQIEQIKKCLRDKLKIKL